MVEINDGKHFLQLEFIEQHIATKVICEADPFTGACRPSTYDSDFCMVRDAWEGVYIEMLAESKDRTILPKFPIKYWTDGPEGPECEDWVEVIGGPQA